MAVMQGKLCQETVRSVIKLDQLGCDRLLRLRTVLGDPVGRYQLVWGTIRGLLGHVNSGNQLSVRATGI